MQIEAHWAVHNGRAAAPCAVASDEEAEAFRRWVDSLPVAGHEALLQVRAYGYTEAPTVLHAQLARALDAPNLAPAVKRVGARVLRLLARQGKGTCFLLGEGG